MPALSVSNLTMTFIERNLFTDVSFEVESRDKVGFIGANGVGKTTLFKILDGEISPTSGNVVLPRILLSAIWSSMPAIIHESAFITNCCPCSII